MLNHFSRVWLFVTLWTLACQAPLSMGFSREEHGVGYHALLQGIFLTQESNLSLSHWQAVFLTTSTTWEAPLSKATATISWCSHTGEFITSSYTTTYILATVLGIYPAEHASRSLCGSVRRCASQHCLQQHRVGSHLGASRQGANSIRCDVFIQQKTRQQSELMNHIYSVVW